ncbi:MAG TPA: hypothetical protein VNI61_05770 [Gemmatimonadales bacterium]|nr:hypothetical protein [Gemmatimonadales bacterium]
MQPGAQELAEFEPVQPLGEAREVAGELGKPAPLGLEHVRLAVCEAQPLELGRQAIRLATDLGELSLRVVGRS